MVLTYAGVLVGAGVGVGLTLGVGVGLTRGDSEGVGVGETKSLVMRLVVPLKTKNPMIPRTRIVARPAKNDFMSYIIYHAVNIRILSEN